MDKILILGLYHNQRKKLEGPLQYYINMF